MLNSLDDRPCAFCHDMFTPKKADQRFCTNPAKKCRQNWHAANKGPRGQVYGVYQRPGGGWSVVIHYQPDQLPKISRGDKVEIHRQVRPDA